MSEADIEKEIAEEMPEETLDVLTENKTAFFWFIDVDEFWQWSQGVRVALDIQTILLDAETTDRKFSRADYTKLKLLGRYAVEAQALKQHEQ